MVGQGDDGLEVWLETRGLSTDYRWIGGEPDPWWRRYTRWSRMEVCTVLVEPGRFIISGIWSPTRRDRTNTPIRYAIAGEVSSEAGRDLALCLLHGVQTAFDGRGRLEALGRLLDAAAGERVEEWLGGNGPSGKVARDCVLEVARACGPPDALPAARRDRVHVGPKSRGWSTFLALSRELLGYEHQDGVAACLNLASQDDVAPVAGKFGCCVLLTPDGLDDPKAAAPPASGRFLLALGALAVTLMIIALLAYILGRS